MKPLDFVRIKNTTSEGISKVLLTDKGLVFERSDEPIDESQYNIGIVREIGSMDTVAVTWIWKTNTPLKTAWWNPDELEIVDNLPNLLARDIAHPFGNGASMVDKFYPVEIK